MFGALFLISVFAIANCQIYQLLPPIICDDNSWIVTRVIFSYFDDQAFMTVVDDSGLSHSLNLLSCEGSYYFRALTVYSTIDEINFGVKITDGSLSSYPTTQGYLIRTFSENFEENFLKKLSSFNPRTSLMFNLVNVDFEASKDWLKIAYDEYKLLNIVALCYKPKIEDNFLIEIEVFMCLYNPFSEKSSDIICLNFDNENLEENLVKMKDFRKKRIENLQGFPLKIDIFEYGMKSVAVYDKSGKISHFTYPDGELLNSIAKIMNFTPVYLEREGKATYGFQFPNGTFTGSLAATEYGKADLVANPRLIADYNTKKSIFLRPITMTKLFFVIKKRETRRVIDIFVFSKLDSFSFKSSMGLIFLFPVVYWFVLKTEIHLTRQNKRMDKIKTLLYIFALLHNISSTHPKLQASRIVVITILFYTLMSSTLFQVTILQDLNTLRTIGKVSKIDQLFEKNFTISMQPALTYMFQEQSDDRMSKELNRISRNIDGTSLSVNEFTDRMKTDSKFAYLLMDLLTGNYLDRFYDHETGENLFEVIPESAFQFYIAMMAPKSSPFIDRFNQIINKYVETGLYQYHTQKAIDDNEKVWIHRIKNGYTPRAKRQSLKLSDLQALIKLYLSLVGFCCVIFFFEYLTGH